MNSSIPVPHEPRIPTEVSAEITMKGEWITVPALRIDSTTLIATGKWLKTASILHEEWSKIEFEAPEMCVDALKKQRAHALRADLFTFSQKLPETEPKYSYVKELESIAAIRITTFKEWWDGLPQVTRKNVRRSEKRGAQVIVKALDDELVQDIVELTRDSPVRQGKRFVHYGKSFEQVKKDQSTFLDHSDFICAYSEKELIGMAKIVYCGQTAAVLQFLPKASQQDKRPANAMLAKMVEVCEAKGIAYLVFGLYNYGNKRGTSLLEFKVRNGFQEYFVPRFYVPLNLKGSLALKLHLHRGAVGILPNRFIATALRLRQGWYSVRGFLGRRSSTLEQPNRIRQMERSIPPAGSNQDLES